MTKRLPAEWEKQDGILLPWPHPATDWAEMLDQVEPVFLQIAKETSRFEKVIIIAPDTSLLSEKLSDIGTSMENIRLIDIETNDTWARDFGPITVYDNDQAIPLDFQFNGWGGKFRSDLDNRITTTLAEKKLFGSCSPLSIDMVLEGGSIDSDGKGNLLTTTSCLLNLNRNPGMKQAEISQILYDSFGIRNILWLESGMLLGDDTDSHIDILARFAPNDTILFVACDDQDDPHFDELAAMRKQLETFRTDDDQPYRLIPLPMPTSCFDDAGNRLAATYANFLVINDAVLVPVYNDPLDQIACDKIAVAFPKREVISIDCSPLILEGGSLHCSTMQFPKGVLA